MSHTSGIADYLETPTSGVDVTADFGFFFSPQYILENVVNGVPDFDAGSGFQYSNSNYVLSALIAESVTGNPVETELRNRVWNPMGMEHTYFGAYDQYTEPTAGVWWNFGSGVTNYSAMPTTSMLSYAYAAGNIVSSPSDLAVLLDGVLNGQLLSEESLNEMLTFIPASFSSWTAGYGLGIHHAAGESDDTLLGHDGYYSNLTDMFHSVNHGFTLVTMTNTQTSWFGLFDPMYEVVTTYFLEGNYCPGDVNQDGQIDVQDFILLNSGYGGSCDDFCPHDMNGDSSIDVIDFILFNSVFGTDCQSDQ